MDNKQKAALVAIIAVMAFAGGFGGSFFWQKSNGKATANELIRIVKEGENKSNITLTPAQSIRTLPNKSNYYTFIVNYKASDSSVLSIQSADDNVNSQKITGTGPYLFMSGQTTFGNEETTLTYRAIATHTLGFYEDTVFGFDTISNSNVKFHLGDIVRIVRGGSRGNVVFGVVSLENTTSK